MFLSTPVIKVPGTTKPFFVTTDTSLTASRGVLMQKDSNGDFHPCTYHFATFSPVERNYNIYDWELLAIIQTLKEWRHYLTGTEHLVVVITDHKNLGYFNLRTLHAGKLIGGCSCKNMTSNGGWKGGSIWDWQMHSPEKMKSILATTIERSPS